MMRRLGEAVLGVALLLGIFQSGCCVQFDVKDEGNKTCILADLSVNFTVDYKQAGKAAIAKFSLPGNATVDSRSSCGVKEGTVPVLAIAFGSGNSLILNFNKSDASYYVDKLTFNYNLSDANYFPGSTENETKQAGSSKSEISAKTSQFYKCSSPHFISMGNANATFYNVKLEAYLNGGNYSKEATTCKDDTPTTAPPTTTPTSAPTVPPVNPTPETGDYKVNASGTVCVLARMGLHLNITYKKKDDKNASYDFNIVPKNVTSSGSCAKDYATLQLSSEEVTLLFNFTLNATENKFYLRLVHVNTTIPDAKDPKFNADGGNLSYLQTSTHKSYKCNSKQTLQITDNFSIDTYSLQVQAFDIDGNKFGPVVECAADQNGMLVPIIVGAALAGLVLIVLIAYLIGRKRSHAGYQTI